MENLLKIFSITQIVTLFKHLFKDLMMDHPLPWKIESDRGCYIVDAKNRYVVSQGIHPDDAEKLIELANACAKENDEFSESFEKEMGLEPGTLGRTLPQGS